ncbi:MAG: pyruvate kinase alpha/beta domain-containing protein, partial [Smithella sp.]
RPRQPIVALSPNIKTLRRLALCWGCQPRFINDPQDTDDMIEKAASSARDAGDVSVGDLIVITVGHPFRVSGTTNMLRVKRVT